MDEFEKNMHYLAQGLKSLQQIQAEYDKIGWIINDSAFEKFRHIAIHLAMISGDLAKYCEAWEHAVKNHDGNNAVVEVKDQSEQIRKVISNLLFHSAQLANLIDTDAFDCLTDLYEANAKLFASNSQFAQIK